MTRRRKGVWKDFRWITPSVEEQDTRQIRGQGNLTKIMLALYVRLRVGARVCVCKFKRVYMEWKELVELEVSLGDFLIGPCTFKM